MAAKPAQPQQGSALDKVPTAAKFGIGIVVVAMLGGLYFGLFYGEVNDQIDGARQRHTKLEQDFAKAKLSQEEYQKDLDEKTVREQRARDQKKLLPDEAETPAFLSAVQSVATVSGVSLTSWSPIEDVPQQFYAKVPMKLSLTGRYHQIAKFFHGVGQLDRIINVEDIRMKAGKVDDLEVPVHVDCLATAFRAVRSDEGPSGDGKAKKGAKK